MENKNFKAKNNPFSELNFLETSISMFAITGIIMFAMFAIHVLGTQVGFIDKMKSCELSFSLSSFSCGLLSFIYAASTLSASLVISVRTVGPFIEKIIKNRESHNEEK
jgi:hypothetical protein